MATESTIRLVSLYPTLLGTYGDGGNVLGLRHRAMLRGLPVDIHEVLPGDGVPRDGDLYVLGGGEDTAQVAAANALRADGGLADAQARGAAVLAICAGYQLLGEYFPDATGSPAAGVGLLDIRTDRLPARAVGELAAEPASGAPAGINQMLSGYENHAGATHLGPDAAPLATVRAGIGNGDGTEGAVTGRVIGTYLHGPCLARNPQIADRLLSWVVGYDLEPVVEPEVEALRAERLHTVLG
ncbi:MAG: type 1 glutamine amidotransferase [Candidatus Nanopelagicales bacterium]